MILSKKETFAQGMLESKLGHCFVACVHANLVNYADLTSENTQNGTLSWKLGQMPPRTQLNFFATNKILLFHIDSSVVK